MLGWADLDEPWRACLEEAWTAYRAGSLPIGAVVDRSEQVVGRGRNRIFRAALRTSVVIYSGKDWPMPK